MSYKKLLNYKLPNRKKWLLTDDFLKTFKEELDKVFSKSKPEYPTYYNFYTWLDGTNGYYDALRTTSEKYNVTKAIYEYANNLPWYDSDGFCDQLTRLMVSRGIVQEGIIDIGYTDEQLIEMERNGKIEWVEEVIKYKDYSVIKRDWKFVDEEWRR